MGFRGRGWVEGIAGLGVGGLDGFGVLAWGEGDASALMGFETVGDRAFSTSSSTSLSSSESSVFVSFAMNVCTASPSSSFGLTATVSAASYMNSGCFKGLNLSLGPRSSGTDFRARSEGDGDAGGEAVVMRSCMSTSVG